MRIHATLVIFEDSISPEELAWFRGAMINLANGNPLFHNHRDAGYEYRYPRIQYKRLDGHPAILGIEEGADPLASMFRPDTTLYCRLGTTTRKLRVASVGQWENTIGMTTQLHDYVIENWLPLNARNYTQYHDSPGVPERLAMLDRILTGNILSFFKGLGCFFDSQVIARLENIRSNGSLTYKGVGLLSFSGTFKSNVILPQWIGLGKSASLNHGIITQL